MGRFTYKASAATLVFAAVLSGGAAWADVTIGVAGPITGANASFGAQLTQGVGQAAEDFNLEQLAAQAGLSKFHFHRLFKSAMGVSPLRYHLNLRMDAARRLLRETKRSVVDVAMDVGYTNPSHFAQLFRRETGMSPSEYRRQR